MVDRGRERGAAAGAKPKPWTVVVIIVVVDTASATASSPPSACCRRGGIMLVVDLLLGARAWYVVSTPVLGMRLAAWLASIGLSGWV